MLITMGLGEVLEQIARVWKGQAIGSKSLVHQASLGKVNWSSLRRVWCHSRISFVPFFLQSSEIRKGLFTRFQSGRSSFLCSEEYMIESVYIAGWRVSSTLPSLSLVRYLIHSSIFSFVDLMNMTYYLLILKIYKTLAFQMYCFCKFNLWLTNTTNTT